MYLKWDHRNKMKSKNIQETLIGTQVPSVKVGMHTKNNECRKLNGIINNKCL